MNPSPELAAEQSAVTLTNCDAEPIHIPGSIQPYGFLLCLDPASQLVVTASENTAAQVGVPAPELLGQPVARLLGEARAAEVAALLPTLTEQPRLLGTRLDAVEGQPFYKLILNRADGLLWLEFEPLSETDASAAALDLSRLNEALGQLLGAGSLLELCELAARQVRAITGFDRVAIYRFAADDSGEVVAEDAAPDMPSWLGLRYPASDIPRQARALFLKNWLRFIPDAYYRPARLLPTCPPGFARPPDMTYSVLRSVSPIHLEYLHNLGSAATMTISLIDEGRLWGMITCHHRTPRLVSYELRDLSQFIGKTVSSLIRSKHQQDGYEYRLAIQARQTQLLEQAAAQPDLGAALTGGPVTLASVFACGGAALCLAGAAPLTVGQVPAPADLQRLLDWLGAHAPADVFETSSLAGPAPELGRALRATAAGVLAVRLGTGPRDYLLWLRPEVVQTVTWAGRDEKPQRLENGQIFLSPRQSFEAWKQTVELQAQPWQPAEVEAASVIRQFVTDRQLRTLREVREQARTLGQLNAELTRSNEELDAFTYVASHDLREPLRGIHNYSQFLLEDYADKLDEQAAGRLQTLVRLSQRMEGLLDGMLHVARAGRQELVTEPVNLGEVLTEALDLLHPRLSETNTRVTVTGPLPTVLGDAVQLVEVFSNLLTNAMKYSDRPEKHVAVGVAPAGTHPAGQAVDSDAFCVIFVQDDGIGIEPRYHERIFQLFKRLHGVGKYGGGTGAGLAIVRRIIERLGGALWLASAKGQGTTFYFSLPKAAA